MRTALKLASGVLGGGAADMDAAINASISAYQATATYIHSGGWLEALFTVDNHVGPTITDFTTLIDTAAIHRFRWT